MFKLRLGCEMDYEFLILKIYLLGLIIKNAAIKRDIEEIDRAILQEKNKSIITPPK